MMNRLIIINILLLLSWNSALSVTEYDVLQEASSIENNYDIHQCDANNYSAKRCNKNTYSDKVASDLDRLCRQCRLTAWSINDLVRRPRQVDLYGNVENKIELDKIKKLVCRDYMNDTERDDCRDFYFSNLPTIIDWKEANQLKKVGFQDFVCIQRLKYCCPPNSFGPKCKKCPVCQVNEMCSGEGSRNGNGTCICKDGHTGPDCVSCLPGYFSPGKKATFSATNANNSNDLRPVVNETICRKCHRSCLYCRDVGPVGCEVCKQGFVYTPIQGCSDIDECIRDTKICGPNTFCVNTEGSYFCYDCDRGCDGCHSDGPDGCLRCARGYTMEGGVCKAARSTILKPEAHYARYFIYFGLGVTSLILFNTNLYLSASIGLIATLYAGGSEYFLSVYMPH